MRRVFEKIEPTFKIHDVKVVREQNGDSKGFGFVTYMTDEEAQAIINKPAGTFCYKNRPWNIAPAFRRYTPHSKFAFLVFLMWLFFSGPMPNYVCYQYSPSLIQHPNGMVYPSYIPQPVTPGYMSQQATPGYMTPSFMPQEVTPGYMPQEATRFPFF